MKVTRLLASLLLLLGVTASTAFAQGAVSLNWNNCTGPVNLNTTGGAVVNAYVSVLGHSQVAQSYEVKTRGGSAGPIADAWRFDPTGCQGSSGFTLNHLAPNAVKAACPSFQGAIQSVQVKDYSYDPTTGKVQIVLADLYPNNGAGNPGAVTPTQRYFLANYAFDLSLAVVGPGDPSAGTCGGVEVPVCFALYQADWLDLNGMQNDWTVAQDYITSNDPNNSSHCPGAVPTVPKTWGSVKSQYRN